MIRYLLDTNICIFYLRGNVSVRDHLRMIGRESCAISEITIFELRYGAENSDDRLLAHQKVDDFLAGMKIISILGLALRYAREKARLRKGGILLHDEFDLLIGVTAVENDFVLVTDNTKHLGRIENIKLENWVLR